MDIRSKTDVVSEVPADVIRIVVDHDVIGIPQPIVTETDIVRSDGEIESAEPETARASASEPPYMFAPKPSGEATMLPRMVDVVIGIAPSGVMTDPTLAIVDVRGVRMSFLLLELAMFLDRSGIFYSGRTVRGNVLMAPSDFRLPSGLMLSLRQC